MVEVINIGDRLPKPDAELVDCGKSFLSEIQNGRVTAFVAVYVSDEGTIGRSYFYNTQAEQLALEHVIDFEALEALTQHIKS